jgi:hypothetical protein
MTDTDLLLGPQARRRTAFHEAGHAVVGWALGLHVGWVRIEDDYNGKADIGICDHLPPVDQIAVAMGGWYGATLSGVEPLHDDETLGDHAHALNVTNAASPDDEEAGDAVYQEGCERAHELVTRHADLVVLVAAELLKHREIRDEDAVRLLPPLQSENPA